MPTLLLALFMACTPAALQHHPPQPAAPEAIAADLVAATGLEYVARRDDLLGAPQGEFESVTAALRAIPGSYRPAALADALEVRRAHPGLAAQFDGVPQAAWDRAKLSASGERMIILYEPGSVRPPEYAPLVVEFVLKRSDAAAKIRSAFVHAVPARGEAVLAVLEMIEDVPDSFGPACEHACRLAADTHDDRIPPAIAAAYDRHRERFPDDYMSLPQATYLLREVHTAAGLDAIRGIIASERSRMETAGYASWDDAGAREDFGAALLQQDREQRAAARRREQLSPETRAQLDAAVEHAKARKDRRANWENLNGTLAALEAALAP